MSRAFQNARLRFCVLIIVLLLTGMVNWQRQAAAAEALLTVGVLAVHAKDAAARRWQPLADYLATRLPGYRFEILPLDHIEIQEAIDQQRLDFILTNPGNFVTLRVHNRLSAPLATLVEGDARHPVSVYGGVIFTRSDRKDINRLQDVAGKSLAVVDRASSGGYQFPVVELLAAGIRIEEKQLKLTGLPQTKVVQAVLSGTVDVGFVRTGLVEELEAAGTLAPGALKIINRQRHAGYPFAVSTRLYPDWAFVALPRDDETLARQVAAALLLLEHDSAVPRQGGYHGFTIPADYTPYEQLLRELRLPPFETAPQFTAHDVWLRYRTEILISLALAGTLTICSGLLVLLNRRLALVRRQIEKTARELQEAQHIGRIGSWRWEVGSDWVNGSRELYRILGFTPDDQPLRRSALVVLCAPAEREMVAAKIAQVLAAGGEFAEEVQLRPKNGACRTCVIRGEVEKDGQDRAIQLIGTLQDISERKEIEARIVAAMEAADAANQAKSAFLADMSHEIRTPMNGIVGMAELLRLTELTAEQQEYLDGIDLSCESLLQLINNILDLSKIEAGKIELETVPFAPARVIDEVARLLLPRVRQKGLSLHLDLSAALPASLCGDPLRFKQILFNLLGNAVKFTESGLIVVRVALEEQHDREVRLRCSVTDSGIGMTPETLARIFSPFVQADAGISRKFGGTGLGLTISRKLADLMGGTLRAESTLGHGSTFYLEIPLRLPD